MVSRVCRVGPLGRWDSELFFYLDGMAHTLIWRQSAALLPVLEVGDFISCGCIHVQSSAWFSTARLVAAAFGKWYW